MSTRVVFVTRVTLDISTHILMAMFIILDLCLAVYWPAPVRPASPVKIGLTQYREMRIKYS